MREFSWLHNFESREDIHEFRNLGCSHETFDFSFGDSSSAKTLLRLISSPMRKIGFPN